MNQQNWITLARHLVAHPDILEIDPGFLDIGEDCLNGLWHSDSFRRLYGSYVDQQALTSAEQPYHVP